MRCSLSLITSNVCPHSYNECSDWALSRGARTYYHCAIHIGTSEETYDNIKKKSRNVCCLREVKIDHTSLWKFLDQHSKDGYCYFDFCIYFLSLEMNWLLLKVFFKKKKRRECYLWLIGSLSAPDLDHRLACSSNSDSLTKHFFPERLHWIWCHLLWNIFKPNKWIQTFPFCRKILRLIWVLT